LREEIPEMKRVRKYRADLEFPCVNADYLLETFGYELITEEVLIQRMKFWNVSSRSSYDTAYKNDERRMIESNLNAWRNQLCEINLDFQVDPHIKKLAYQIAKFPENTDELRAEALHDFRSDIELLALDKLFPTHCVYGRSHESIILPGNPKKRAKLMKEFEDKLPSHYKWRLNFFRCFPIS
jgi:hypothetical protein